LSESANPEFDMAKHSILIVEDEYILALDLKKQLQDLGYLVVAYVASGEEALAEVEAKKPEMVLMDIKIKGSIDGIETAKIIENRHDIPIVYLSAFSNDEYLKRAKITKPFGYLLKPVNKRELAATIEMAFYKHGIEQILKKNEAWFMSMLSSIGDGVIATDGEGKIQFMNSVAESLCEWEMNEAKDKDINEVYSIVREGFNEKAAIPFKEIIKNNAGFKIPPDTVFLGRSGRKTFVNGKVSPLMDRSGKTVGVILIFHDVSEYREMELRIRNLEKFRIFGQIVSGVAHEVRNPLNAILAVTEAMVLELGQNQDFVTYLQHINTQVKRLSTLMKDLLDLGKPIRTSSMQRESVVSICEAGIHLWMQSTPKQSQDVVFHPDRSDEELFVNANSDKLQQVIFNLLENAAQHIQNGEKIELKILRLGPNTAAIRVIDRGVGIPDENLTKVFEPFFTTTKGGIGLGLSIVRNIVEQHNGDVDVWNTDPPPGCTVEIRLPLLEPS
jgi:PAS domain S-box-containing protein